MALAQVNAVSPTMGKAQARFFVNQMLLGAVTYDAVITARPDLKIYIDEYIIANNLQDKIIGFVPPIEPPNEGDNLIK